MGANAHALKQDRKENTPSLHGDVGQVELK
jgi:hypothetical protein